MIRPLFLLLLLLLMNVAHAQVGGGISFGYRGGMMRSKTFNTFRDGYNTYFKGQGDKDLNGFGIGSGYGVNADLNVNGFVVAVRFSEYQTKDRFHFISGGKRSFKLEETYFTIAMGGGVQVKKAHFNATLGLVAGRNEIESSYTYSNGMESYGSERTLNGIYKSMRVGGSARLEFSYLFFYLSGEYIFAANPNATLSDGFRMEGIPTNYPQWLSQPSWDYGIDDFIKADFGGLRFEFGLRFQFKDE